MYMWSLLQYLQYYNCTTILSSWFLVSRGSQGIQPALLNNQRGATIFTHTHTHTHTSKLRTRRASLLFYSVYFLRVQYCLKVNQVEDERRRRRWVQDSEKKKLQVSKDNFFPVPLGRNRKEIATQWFLDLASSKPLSQLAKKVRVAMVHGVSIHS